MTTPLTESKLDVLISEQQIQDKIDELAEQVRTDFGNEPILLVGVLKGSFMFLSDFCRRLDVNISVDFVQTSSYGAEKSSSGVVQIRKDLDINIEDKNVLIVEDIIDTGTTLNHLRELLSTRKPKSLRVVTLLSKPEARKSHTPVEYVGFEIPNEFVVGYGLDYAERYRNLPYIALLRE
jgi:hypoxanthine phosphoribosyltransferase